MLQKPLELNAQLGALKLKGEQGRCKRMFEEQAVDAGLTAKEEIVRDMKSVINRLHHGISIRCLRM